MSFRKIQPGFLKPGDEVAIISPAFAIEAGKVESAVRLLEEWGLRVTIGRNALKQAGPYAGTDNERLADFQEMTDKKNVKAIICSRGGYGMLKIVDRIDFSSLKKHPKWFVGFSDITVLHIWLSERQNLITIHGEMPLNFCNEEKSEQTLNSLRRALFGNWEPVSWEGEFRNPAGVSGEVTGGNLSLIFSLTGTPGEIKTKGKILFIEEVGEYYYHYDRMLTSLKMAGKLKDLAALVVGSVTEMKETGRPWNKSIVDITYDLAGEYGYPVLFSFPAGHVPDNRAFYIGRKANISIEGGRAMLSYL